MAATHAQTKMHVFIKKAKNHSNSNHLQYNKPENNHNLKENSGKIWTFGLIKHRYLVNRSLRFVFMIIEC